MRSSLDKLGSFGAVIAAAACPICFPKLALVGALLGLGGLGAYEAQLFIAAQALVGVAVLGHIVSYRQHRRQWRLASAVVGGGAFFLGVYVFRSEWLAYAGLAALIAGSIPDLRFRPPAERRAGRDARIDCYVPDLRPSTARDNADRRLPVLL